MQIWSYGSYSSAFPTVSSQGFQRLEFVQDEHLSCLLDWEIVRGLIASADIAIQPFCSFVILLALSPN